MVSRTAMQLVGLGLFALAAPSPSTALPPSVFLSADNLDIARQRIVDRVEPYWSVYNSLVSTANGLLSSSANPFFMADIRQITFGWCGAAGLPDDSLKDLVEKITTDSHRARNLALAYLFTGQTTYATKARDYLLAWVRQSSLLNLYDLNINFQAATFDGIESGYCNKSWNMALDTIWQGHGLINFADAYAILVRNSTVISPSETTEIAAWIRSHLFPAVNSGFHAWTRWADLHPSSSAYTRYRCDNHLSWSLAALAAAAAALDDDRMWTYVYHGGTYDDGRSGPYANPSHFTVQIGRAIASDGKVFDHDVRAPEHTGLFYAHFNVWALSLCAQIAETSEGANYWTYRGSQGGTLADALDYYARFVAGDLTNPDTEETTDPAFFRFLYELVVGNSWVTGSRSTLYSRAMTRQARNQMLTQSIGPVVLVAGNLPEPSSAPPNTPAAPANLQLSTPAP